MEKIRLVARTLVLVAFGLLQGVHCSAYYTRNSRTSSCIVDVASSQLGVHETRPNDGPEIRLYLHSVGIYTPAPWCAAFVNWCLTICGVDSPINGWAASAVARNVVYVRGGRNNKTVEPGDVAALYYPSMNRVGHAFIIEDWGSGNKVRTIEGNSNDNGSREGTSVVRRIRLKKTIYKVSRYR